MWMTMNLSPPPLSEEDFEEVVGPPIGGLGLASGPAKLGVEGDGFSSPIDLVPGFGHEKGDELGELALENFLPGLVELVFRRTLRVGLHKFLRGALRVHILI